MRHLDLFSGIAGFALAARNVGWDTVAFCEIDPWCRKILRKHWPEVPIYDDIKTVMADAKSFNGKRAISEGNSGGRSEAPARNCGSVTDGTTTVGPIDIITAGFPCQDISAAGKQAGITGERSGLWSECARLLGEIRPRFAVFENVTALLSGERGEWFQQVLWDISQVGYDAEWHCIPASATGAPHRRDRVWIIAYPDEQRRGGKGLAQSNLEHDICESAQLCNGQGKTESEMADTNVQGLEGRLCRILQERTSERITRQSSGTEHDQWAIEPDVGRVADGVPSRVDRLRGLGNAIVPQVAEIIFRAIDGH